MANPQSVTHISHLPDDVVLEILARLPVKSLVRLRRVCKSWNSSITSPYFIATHLKYGRCRGYCLLYESMKRETKRCMVVCDRTYDTIADFQRPFMFTGIVGSCNGLLCVESKCRCLFMWNPSIKKVKVLPDTRLARSNTAAYGFGYDSEKNDYKIVRISYDEFKPSLPEAEVYTLRSNSWTRVNGIPLRPDILVYTIACNYFTCPFVGGALHWIMRSKGSDGRINKAILSFDLSDDKFGEIALPSLPSIEKSCWYYKSEYLGVFMGNLASFRFVDGRQCSIWVMTDNGVAESWTQFMLLQFDERVNFYGCTESGALVVTKRHREFRVCFIDPVTSHEDQKNLGIGHRLIFAAPFVESLVLQDGESVKSLYQLKSLLEW